VDCTPCATNASFTVDSVSTTGRMYVTNKSTGAKYYYWSFGDSTFSKDKTPGKTFSASGAYVVCLTAYDSLQKCSTTYCVTVKVVKGRSTLGIEESNALNSTLVYPNPSDAGFWIETPTNGSFQIITTNGIVVKEGNTSKKAINWVNTSDLSNGLYLIQIKESTGKIQQQSIVVQHP